MRLLLLGCLCAEFCINIPVIGIERPALAENPSDVLFRRKIEVSSRLRTKDILGKTLPGTYRMSPPETGDPSNLLGTPTWYSFVSYQIQTFPNFNLHFSIPFLLCILFLLYRTLTQHLIEKKNLQTQNVRYKLTLRCSRIPKPSIRKCLAIPH